METFANYAAKPLPCSVPLAVVLYGAEWVRTKIDKARET